MSGARPFEAANRWTAGQPRADFASRGWLVLRGVVDAPHLVELNQLFDHITSSALAPPGAPASGISLLPNACRAHPALLRHLHDGLAAFIGELLDAPSIRLLQDALLLKRPSGPSTIALHQDYTYTGFLDPPSMVAVGLALSDASADHGCLHVVDGSHAWGPLGDVQVFAPALQADLRDRLTATQRDAVDRRRLPLEVRAGDVTIHHCLTLHGSDGNRSGHPRKTILTHLFSGACRLLPDRLPEAARDHFPTDAHGHLIGQGFPQLHP